MLQYLKLDRLCPLSIRFAIISTGYSATGAFKLISSRNHDCKSREPQMREVIYDIRGLACIGLNDVNWCENPEYNSEALKLGPDCMVKIPALLAVSCIISLIRTRYPAHNSQYIPR